MAQTQCTLKQGAVCVPPVSARCKKPMASEQVERAGGWGPHPRRAEVIEKSGSVSQRCEAYPSPSRSVPIVVGPEDVSVGNGVLNSNGEAKSGRQMEWESEKGQRPE